MLHMIFLCFNLKSYPSPTPHSALSVSFHSKLLFAGIQEARRAYSSVQRRKLRTNNTSPFQPSHYSTHPSPASVSFPPTQAPQLPISSWETSTTLSKTLLDSRLQVQAPRHNTASLKHFELWLQVAGTESVCICCPKSNIPALLLTPG